MKRDQIIINSLGNTKRKYFLFKGQLNTGAIRQALKVLAKYASILESQGKK